MDFYGKNRIINNLWNHKLLENHLKLTYLNNGLQDLFIFNGKIKTNLLLCNNKLNNLELALTF